MNLLISNFIFFFKQNKILFVLFGVSLLMLVGILVIPSKSARKQSVDYYQSSKNSTGQIVPTTGSLSQEGTSSNQSTGKARSGSLFYRLFYWFDPGSQQKKLAKTGYIIKKSLLTNAGKDNSDKDKVEDSSSSANLANNQNSNLPKSGVNTPGLVKLSDTSQNDGAQENPQSPTQETIQPPSTDIQIVFRDENGELWTYTPPDGSTDNIGWDRYVNEQDGFEIDIPSNWQITKTQYNGHEGVILYPPGEDLNKVDVQTISFVPWQLDYLTVSATYTSVISVNQVLGNLYTKGAIGKSTIAAVFQPKSGYFALGSSSSDVDFLNIFDHMLRSIVFTRN